MSSLLERLGIDLPVFQAGMAGGVARHELAVAVSEAGGLGTLGTEVDADELERELDAARAATAKPIAVNLLLPFTREAHWRVARRADAVITFWGRPVRRSPGIWLHQCGSLAEASSAKTAGADGVIVQGHEAGGHVRGSRPALELLEEVRAAFGPRYPLLLAGGIADAGDVRTALDAGADGVVSGTRFVMSEESHARRAYKQRLMESRETVVTELFNLGWPNAPQRVLWNEACERWLAPDGTPPAWVRRAQRALSLAPQAALLAMVPLQRPELPLLGPLAATDDRPPALLDAGALYAGESVARIHDVRPAGELVRALAP